MMHSVWAALGSLKGRPLSVVTGAVGKAGKVAMLA
jgi:hypothetical protein